MRALVIGFGSIGQRHTRLLMKLGCDVAVVSHSGVGFSPSYNALDEALNTHRPEYCVIANATNEHFDTLTSLKNLGFNGRVLIEKPLFDRTRVIPKSDFERVAVGYNLRFHPLIALLREELEDQKIISVHAYVGQHLPSWRPNSNYIDTYSASLERGGGVLLDLSHELDYLNWIFGPWQSLSCISGKFSDLDISSDDTLSLLGQFERCPALTLTMNYLDRVGRREIVVNTDKHTIKVDFIRGEFLLDDTKHCIPPDQDYTYNAIHLEMMSPAHNIACSLAEGMDILLMVDACRQAANCKTWINR